MKTRAAAPTENRDVSDFIMRYYDDEDQLPEPAFDEDDRELPDPEDMSSGDEPGLETCPYCRKLISEEAEQCPHCGSYIVEDDRPKGKSVAVTVIILGLVVAAVAGWLLLR